VNALIGSETFNVSPCEEETLRAIAYGETKRTGETRQTENEEIFVIDPYNHRAVIPTRSIDRYFYYLTTDEQEDRRTIQEMINGGMSIDRAIRAMVEKERANERSDKEGGTAREEIRQR
jgi:uncharacterized protein YoaH (UPF0181 family)